MNKKFLIKFALRNLITHPLRTLLTLAGVIIGISAILFLVSFAFGIERLVTTQVTGGDAFALVDVGIGNSRIVALDQSSIDAISKISNVQEVEPAITAGAKAKNSSGAQTDAVFFGTSKTYFDWLGTSIRWGNNLSSDKNAKDVIVNTAYIKFIGGDSPQKYLDSKQKFDVIIPKELTAAGQSIEIPDQEYTIVGIYQDDSAPIAYTNYNNLSSLGAAKYSQAKVEVGNQNDIAAVRKQIENLGYKTQYIGDTVTQIQQVFNIFKIILGGFGLVALIVAAIGMFNTLTISLLERTKEVALMKILGAKKKDINLSFLSESIILGVVGGVLGIGIGFGLGEIVNTVFNHFAVNAGGNPVSVFYYPVWFIISLFVFSCLIGFLTGAYPAYRATRLNALDVLRYE